MYKEQYREVTSDDQTTSTVRIIRRETTDQKIRQTEDDVRDQIRQVISERDSTEDSTVIWRMLVRVWTDHRLMLFKYPGLWIGLFKITHRPNILYIRSRRMYCPSSCIITNLTLSSKCKLLDHTVQAKYTKILFLSRIVRTCLSLGSVCLVSYVCVIWLCARNKLWLIN